MTRPQKVMSILFGVAMAALVMASPTYAQVTGTVTGVVQDAQAGRIPGANVTLTSETKGTKLPDAITTPNGDYTFVNVAPDTYTVQVTMSGFKTVTRSGIAVAPGDHLTVPVLTVELGGRTE